MSQFPDSNDETYPCLRENRHQQFWIIGLSKHPAKTVLYKLVIFLLIKIYAWNCIYIYGPSSTRVKRKGDARAPDCLACHACVPGSSPAVTVWGFERNIILSPFTMWLGDHDNGGLVELRLEPVYRSHKGLNRIYSHSLWKFSAESEVKVYSNINASDVNCHLRWGHKQAKVQPAPQTRALIKFCKNNDTVFGFIIITLDIKRCNLSFPFIDLSLRFSPNIILLSYPLECGNRLYTSESDVCRRQIPTSKVDPRTQKVKNF